MVLQTEFEPLVFLVILARALLFSLSIMAILLASTLAFTPSQSAFPGENGLVTFARAI